MADIDAPHAGRAVDQPLAGTVGDVDAVALADERARELWSWQTRLGVAVDGRVAAVEGWIDDQRGLIRGLAENSTVRLYLTELATAAVHRIGVKVLVINNNYLGMVRQWQEAFFDNRLSGVDLEGNPDFVKLAEAYGVKGLRIRRPADIDRKLKEARDHDGPVVVVAEVVKEGNVFPWIPAGAPITDMLIEPPKHKMEKPSGST